ncbi:MAG: hypothetical protein PHU80_05565, partial [Kiritimatiellae bacterium]|nr:hypothetical protein [Kiritimatiellia bacterium]
FLSSWLLWCGLGAAAAASGVGRRVTVRLARHPWVLISGCTALYFLQYALIVNLRVWLGVPDYQAFPLPRLAAGCFLVNAPFCFMAGWVIPALCRRLEDAGLEVSRAFAWEAFGAAAGGGCLLALLVAGIAPDPRDEAEWTRYFPAAVEPPERFETGGGTTFYGSHGGSFYALSSGGVNEVIPEGDHAMELAALVLSQRPYAQRILLLGRVPLAVGLALERVRPDIEVVWCPCDAVYGTRLLPLAAAGSRTVAAGIPPQMLLERETQGGFDAVVVEPPPATTLEGAVWREPAFALAVRRVTHRTGVALFSLDCEVATLTPERAELLGMFVRAVRQAWPETGLFVPGGGGWWVATQVPGLVYGAEIASERFALLKKETVYPAAALGRLYDPERARRLAEQQSALGDEQDLVPPEEIETHNILAAGLANAVRADWPDSTPGVCLSRVREAGGGRLLGLVLLALWMLPVLCGNSKAAYRRLLAACLAACGALGLAVLLALLYRLQMRFGALYLLAGTGGCLYFTGIFIGNRVGQRALKWGGSSATFVRVAIMMLSFVQAVAAFSIVVASERVVSASGLVGLCLAVGFFAGGVVPLALAVCEGSRAEGAAVFVLADALGASVAGLFFAALVPLSGLLGAVAGFSALAAGIGVCVVVCGAHARLAAGVALAVLLAVIGGKVRNIIPADRGLDFFRSGFSAQARPPVDGDFKTLAPRGIPRKINEQRIRAQMRDGLLSTNETLWVQ